MLWGCIPFHRTMNPEVCIMSLFADYVKFCAKVNGQGMTLTFDTHVACSFSYSFSWLQIQNWSSQATIVLKK